MKRIFILFSLILIGAYVQAQSNQFKLNFDKLYIDCVDKWIAFPMHEDSIYVFGFIYFDEAAGLTADLGGSFKISSAGIFKLERNESFNTKIRLPLSDRRVALIPENKLEELQITAIPIWLKSYKTDSLSAQYLYSKGFLYNAWYKCKEALIFLKQANEIDPTFKELNTELAFSYNCLGQYNEAISELQKALELNPTDAYTNKELIYAQVKSGQLDEAATTCKKALISSKDKEFNAENCYNILFEYYNKKDKTNFKYWLKETKKWLKYAEQDAALMQQGVKVMEATFLK